MHIECVFLIHTKKAKTFPGDPRVRKGKSRVEMIRGEVKGEMSNSWSRVTPWLARSGRHSIMAKTLPLLPDPI